MAFAREVRERVDFHRDAYTFLVKGLVKQRKAAEFCDVILEVNGRTFHAHRAVLAATSPYFRSMFTSHMKEQNSDKVDLSESLVLEKDDSFKQILDFLYTGDIEVTTNNAEDILRIADFLLLEDVKDYCRQFFLQHGNLNVSNCLYLSTLADHHNMPDVAKVANRIVKSRFHDYLIFSDHILDLPFDIFNKILRDPETVQFTNREHIVRGILRWIKHHYGERRQAATHLFSCIHINVSSLTDYALKEILQEEVHLTDKELEQKVQVCDRFQGIDGAWCRQAQRTEIHSGNMLDSMPATMKKSESVLLALSCNPAIRHLSIFIYRLSDQAWYTLPISYEPLKQSIPSRLNVCAATFHGNILYMFLSYNLPYPTDMRRIHVIAYDIEQAQHFPLTFRHRYNSTGCCQTTLTDDRSLPPVMLFSNGCLCFVGNLEGSGQIFVCDLTSQTYMCYQIPGTRLVSQARAIVKDECLLYVWCRHRLGHEEYCINKEVSFVVFNVKTKCFNVEDLPPPPGIDYGEFADPHMMCLEKGSLIVHTPGKSSLILDESKSQWLTYNKNLPPIPSQKVLLEMPYQGYELYSHCDSKVYVLQNPAAYTSHLFCLAKEQVTGVPLTPPPADGLSVVTPAKLTSSLIQSLPKIELFDDTFTRLNLNHTHPMDEEGEDCATPHTPNSDSNDEYEFDDFEFDDHIYDYYDQY